MSVDAGAARPQRSHQLVARFANEKAIFVFVLGVILAILVLPPLIS